MNVRLAFALFLLLFLGNPVHAQSLCADCLKVAQEELKQCLDSAISEEDKIACDQRQQEQAKACKSGECKAEREEREKRSDVLPQKN
jgi:hypothetical protein